MIGDLIVFNYDCRCCIAVPGIGSSPAFVESGNVGIIISKYVKDPFLEIDAYEVLVGGQIYFNIDDDVFTELPSK